MVTNEARHDVADEKRALRKRMRALRLVADQKVGPDAARAVMRAFMAATAEVGVTTDSVVAGYWPIGTELDVRPLLARLHERGVHCALPVMMAADRPLMFRRWHPEEAPPAGRRELYEPDEAAPPVVPDVLLVPALAIDRRGYRLGQGGGHFDRTLAALRAAGKAVAIGVGYAVQVQDAVPHDAFDQRMDWILTEDGLERVIP